MDNLTLSKIKKSLQVFGDYRAYENKKLAFFYQEASFFVVFSALLLFLRRLIKKQGNGKQEAERKHEHYCAYAIAIA